MTFLQLKVENLTNENLGGQNENLGGQGPTENENLGVRNLGGQGPTEDKKDNPATRLYVLCQALTPIGLFKIVRTTIVQRSRYTVVDLSCFLFVVSATNQLPITRNFDGRSFSKFTKDDSAFQAR